MTEYIVKETLQAKLNRKKAEPATKRYTEGWNDAILMVKSMIHSEKTADVALVRHAMWEVVVGSDGKEHMVCTGCRKQQDLTGVFSYCPNCGCLMDGGEQDA